MNNLFIILRCVAIFVILMIFIRILGKREVGQLSIFDLVVLLIIADIGAIGIEEKELFFPAVCCLFLLVILQKSFSLTLLHLSSLRDFVDGKPTILIKDGIIQYESFKKEKYTMDDLTSQMRTEGIMDPTEIRLAILETNGKLSVFSKKRYDEIVLPVIMSGRIQKDMISALGLTLEQFQKVTDNYQIDIKKILYASCNKNKLIITKVCDKTDKIKKQKSN